MPRGGRSIHIFDNGVRVYDDHILDVQRERYRIHNVHEAGEEDVFVHVIRALPKLGVYVDIGAAFGYYPILAKKLSPQLEVHAVEPLERHRRYIEENLLLNGLSASEVTVHTEAISASSGVVKFIDSEYGSSVYSGPASHLPLRNLIKGLLASIPLGVGGGKGVEIVRTITLDELVVKIGKAVDLVQMDVQGFEFEVLQGATHSLAGGQIETLLIGTHRAGIHQSCVQMLRQYDYGIEIDEVNVPGQPDGIILAAK